MLVEYVALIDLCRPGREAISQYAAFIRGTWRHNSAPGAIHVASTFIHFPVHELDLSSAGPLRFLEQAGWAHSSRAGGIGVGKKKVPTLSPLQGPRRRKLHRKIACPQHVRRSEKCAPRGLFNVRNFTPPRINFRHAPIGDSYPIPTRFIASTSLQLSPVKFCSGRIHTAVPLALKTAGAVWARHQQAPRQSASRPRSVQGARGGRDRVSASCTPSGGVGRLIVDTFPRCRGRRDQMSPRRRWASARAHSSNRAVRSVSDSITVPVGQDETQNIRTAPPLTPMGRGNWIRPRTQRFLA